MIPLPGSEGPCLPRATLVLENLADAEGLQHPRSGGMGRGKGDRTWVHFHPAVSSN
jgi:hypothetical protein